MRPSRAAMRSACSFNLSARSSGAGRDCGRGTGRSCGAGRAHATDGRLSRRLPESAASPAALQYYPRPIGASLRASRRRRTRPPRPAKDACREAQRNTPRLRNADAHVASLLGQHGHGSAEADRRQGSVLISRWPSHAACSPLQSQALRPSARPPQERQTTSLSLGGLRGQRQARATQQTPAPAGGRTSDGHPTPGGHAVRRSLKTRDTCHLCNRGRHGKACGVAVAGDADRRMLTGSADWRVRVPAAVRVSCPTS